MIFMQEYEKYGNSCMQIAKVLSTRTPTQIKKYAECFFRQNLKTNSVAVKRYREPLSPDRKAQVLINDSAAHQKQQQGRWTKGKHMIFMQEYEKYGNNCMQIAKVLSTQTPAQIKKHAECFFKQNLKTNSVAVKQYRESLSPDRKAQVLGNDSAAHQKQWQSLSLENKVQMLCKKADVHRKQRESLPPEKVYSFLCLSVCLSVCKG